MTTSMRTKRSYPILAVFPGYCRGDLPAMSANTTERRHERQGGAATPVSDLQCMAHHRVCHAKAMGLSAYISRADMDRTTPASIDWLERSAPLPLELSFVCPQHHPSLKPLVEMVQAVSARWHTFRILDIQTADFLEWFGGVTAPQLTDVAISLTDADSDKTHFLASDLFKGSKPCRITIYSLEPQGLVPTLPFTWHHITHLILDCNSEPIPGLRDRPSLGLSIHGAYSLLKGCPYLISIGFHLDDHSDHDHEFSNQELSLKSLSILDQSVVSLDVIASLIEHLIAPRLLHVQIPPALISGPFISGDVPFLIHLAETSPLLSKLYLDVSHFTPTCLADILRRFRSLTILSTFHSRDIGGVEPADVVRRLTPDPNTPELNILPALKELEVLALANRQDSSTTLSDEILFTFLRQHVDCGTNLRRFRIHFLSDPPEIVPDFEPFRINGLHASFLYTPRIGLGTLLSGIGQ
ncbi:hypothetical protein C8R44DRAFT_761679 [Mycena epipterygia]|nr:hypothetical protein C8R44DRAFT_761679 [Mycena epipterygia]